jgi:predicted permease
MRWYQRLFRRARTERQLDAELRLHLEKQVADYIATGLTPEEAHRRARLEFGGLDQVKEECRDVGAARFVETLIQDVRYGLRQLRRNPGFTAVAVITLALGIAANTTIFSAASSFLWRKPAVKDPDRLCVVSSTYKPNGSALIRASAPDFKSWRKQNRVFSGMATAETGRAFTLTGNGEPESVNGDRVTANYFNVLGVSPALGRGFLPGEDQAGNDHVVILSYALWRERFGSDPKVIGKQADIDGRPYAIVGVMPALRGMILSAPSLYVPLAFSPADLAPSARGNHYLNLTLGRLKPGVTIEGAQAEMNSIAQRLDRAYPVTNKDWGVKVLTLQDYLIRRAQTRQFSQIFLLAVGLVLLIACANITGLLLARGAGRAHEMAVRCAVGASRWRLVRQMLTECTLIGAAGGAAGLLVSVWGIDLFRAGLGFNYGGRKLAEEIRLNHTALLFTLAVSAVTVLLFGLAPALQASKTDPAGALTESGRTGQVSPHRTRTRNVLVIGEIALSLALLAGAGLLMQQLLHEINQKNGFNPNHVVTMNIDLTSARYQKPAARTGFFQPLIQRLRGLPGIKSAGAAMGLPFAGHWGTAFTVVGEPLPPGSKLPWVEYFSVGPAYFKTMQIPLIKGRNFSDSDNAHTPLVAIVNQEFAHRYFPKGNAIGRRLQVITGHNKVARIVGVVGNVLDVPGQVAPRPQLYEPYLQVPFSSMSVVVRSPLAPSTLAPMLRKAVWSVDKDQPVESILTMKELANREDGGDKFVTALIGIFASLALILAVVGIYGVIAYSVSRRTHELGIRIALGARRGDILWLMLRQGGLLTGIGCVIGVLLALPLPHLLSGLLNGNLMQTPLLLICVASVVAAVSLIATFIPARRAARVDPIFALRHE